MDGAVWPRPAAARPRRLLVTAHFVFAGRVGGAEHMLYNLLRGLTAAGADAGVLCADEANLDPAFVAELRAANPAGLLASKSGGRGGDGIRFIAEQRACLSPGLAADAILFPNYFVPPIVPRRLGRVATVMHDMQYRHFPANFSAKKRAWLAAAQAYAMRRADTVVAISEFVRQDLLRVYGARFERKVVTIPNPISWDRFGPAGAGAPIVPRPMERPYILSVAAQYAHKNLEALLRGFALLAATDPDIMLVFCGQDYGGLRGVPGQRHGLMPLVHALGLQDRVTMTGYVDDATLGAWYRHAAMFAFPSIFEGFGMPAVEALGFGLPTLTTNRTALPEVTMGLAQYVDDPASAEEWADRARQILRDPQSVRPGADQIAALRDRYSVARVGRQYCEACFA